MNINEMAAQAVDKMEPTLKKMIDSSARSTHPEIVNGRNAMIEKRDRLIAIFAEKMVEESEFVKICALISPHTPSGICTAAEGVAWLVERHKAATKALYKLEEIRTEMVAAKGLGREASAVSAARVILQASATNKEENAQAL